MVFQDIAKSFVLGSNIHKNRTAHIMDRFFAFLIDISVIFPFVFFLLYLTFSNGFNFWKSQPAAPENEIFTYIIIICFIFYFGLIQSLFIVYFGATPGQFFLKIKIHFSEPNDLIFYRSLVRQFSFWISFLFLGIPFLAMMINKDRRTFYDRISDCFLVSLKNEPDLTFENEYAYWKSFMLTLVLFMGFLMSLFMWSSYGKVVDRNLSFLNRMENNYFCADLKDLEQNERLQTAVALNLVNQLSDDCLDKEADFVLWKQKTDDYSLAYYAKSLTTSDPQQEVEYLLQSCQGQNTKDFSSLSLGCQISYSFLKNNFEILYQELSLDNFLSDLLKYELSQILNKSNDIRINFSKLNKYNSSVDNIFNSIKSIKKYQLIEMISEKKSVFSDRLPANISQDREKSETEDAVQSEMIEIIEGL